MYGSNSDIGKLLGLVVIVVILGILIYSCNSDPGYSSVPTEDSTYDESSDSEIRRAGFFKIGSVGNNDLICDIDTNIVYMKSNSYNSHYSLCAYYADNGLPYKYDIETKSLIIIKEE